jgi:hypothetical protein
VELGPSNRTEEYHVGEHDKGLPAAEAYALYGRPLCECGCGKSMRWHKGQGFHCAAKEAKWRREQRASNPLYVARTREQLRRYRTSEKGRENTRRYLRLRYAADPGKYREKSNRWYRDPANSRKVLAKLQHKQLNYWRKKVEAREGVLNA